MKPLLILLFAMICTAAAEDILFDPKKPELLMPGKTYSFVIIPEKNAQELRIRLHAESSDEYKSEDGRPFAPIDKLSVVQGEKTYDLPYDCTDVGVPQIDIADFDGDGDLDFRIITAWGTGGSWYCYYRFGEGRYERWNEPEELGLNGIPDNGFLPPMGALDRSPHPSATSSRMGGSRSSGSRQFWFEIPSPNSKTRRWMISFRCPSSKSGMIRVLSVEW